MAVVLRKRSDFDHLIKVLMLGSSSVGKTSLLHRFISDEPCSAVSATIGIDFKAKDMQHKGDNIRLQIWDTAGQERFRTLTPAYYHSAHGVALVYDVTCRMSFDEVSHWFNELQSHTQNKMVKRILIGNKSDLKDVREVFPEEGERLAAKHGVPFFETSALSGSGVDRAFEQLIDCVAEGWTNYVEEAPETHSFWLEPEVSRCQSTQQAQRCAC